MIKSVFVITLISMASVSFAQTTTPTTISTNQNAVQFGLKAGVNIANVNSEIYKNSNARESFYAGGFVHLSLNDNFGVQPEIYYSRQGFEYNNTTNLDVKGNLDYINIPVLFQYVNRGVRLETGPQLGFLINSEAVYNDGRDNDISDKLKSTDFSWAFGLSYISTFGAGLNMRYNLGISNINKDILRTGVTDTEINNQVWQFGLFYQFNR